MLQSPSKLGKMENLQLQDHISLNYHGLGPVRRWTFHCSYCKNGIRLKHLFFLSAVTVCGTAISNAIQMMTSN